MNLEPEADAALKFMEDRAAGLSLRTKLIAAACVLALLGLAAFAYWPAKPIHEEVKATPQARHDDGSVTAAQAPDAHPPAPKMVLPRGSVRERAGKIVAHQAPGASSVEIDTEFVRIGNRRELHVTSPDGTIDTAVDIPITPELIPPPKHNWAAGISYHADRAIGAWIDRDIGRLRVGAELAKAPTGKFQAEVRVGFVF